MPVVCVRLSEDAVAALEARAAKKGQDRSTWLRGVVLSSLGLAKGGDEVEAILPRPPQSIDPLVPGDRLRVMDPGSPVQ